MKVQIDKVTKMAKDALGLDEGQSVKAQLMNVINTKFDRLEQKMTSLINHVDNTKQHLEHRFVLLNESNNQAS